MSVKKSLKKKCVIHTATGSWSVGPQAQYRVAVETLKGELETGYVIKDRLKPIAVCTYFLDAKNIFEITLKFGF